MTRILITHDMFFIRSLSNRTVVMHQGRINRGVDEAQLLQMLSELCQPKNPGSRFKKAGAR